MDLSLESLILNPAVLTLIIALAISGFIVLLIPIIIKVLDIAPYMYTNAKIRAIEAGLLKKQKIEDLKNAKTKMDCISTLEDTDCGSYLTKLDDPNSEEGIEKALNQHTSEVLEKVSKNIPKDMSNVIRDLYKIYDAKNIKMVFRAIKNDIPIEDRSELIIPMGSMKKPVLKTLIESKTTEEVVSELESTEYGSIVSKAITKVQETGSLTPLELAIDKYVYEKSFKKIALSKDTNMVAASILLGTKIDVINLKTWLRLRSTEQKIDNIEDFTIDASYAFTSDKIKTLQKAETVDEIISQLEGTPYAEILADISTSFKDTGSLYQIETRLDNYFDKTAKQLSTKYGLGIGPALYLITGKESDARKIRMFTSFNQEGIDIETGGAVR